MPTPAVNTPLNQIFDQARANGWSVGAKLKGRFKLTHPKADKPVFANAGVKAGAAIRDLESEMTKALGPVKTMQTPSTGSGRLSKAALMNKTPAELQAIVETATSAKKQVERELLQANQNLQKVTDDYLALGAEVADFKMLRDTLSRIFGFGGSNPSATPRISQAAGGAKPAKGKRQMKAAAGLAGPATQPQATARTKRAAAPAKSALPLARTPRKSAAPGKRAAGAKPGRKAKLKLAPTPLEEAIEASQQGGSDGFTTPAGKLITPENAGELVKAHRTLMKQSQGETGPLLGVSSTTLVNWEKGHTIPEEKALGRVAAYLRMETLGKAAEAQPSSSAAM